MSIVSRPCGSHARVAEFNSLETDQHVQTVA